MSNALSDVPETTIDQAMWLIMVYMQAGDSSNLDSFAVQDLKELQDGVQGSEERKVDGNPNVVVLVQMKREWPSDVPQRYLIRRDKPVETLKQAKREDTTSQGSLEEFLSKGLEIAHGQVKHFCLVLWGHNFGLGFGRDHGDKLTLGELAGALETSEGTRIAARAFGDKFVHDGLCRGCIPTQDIRGISGCLASLHAADGVPLSLDCQKHRQRHLGSTVG